MAGNTVFGWVIKKRLHQMELFKQYPIEVQEEIRQKLIDEAALTAFGKEHKFEHIHSLEDFRKSIPLRSYEEHFPYIEKMILGKETCCGQGRPNGLRRVLAPRTVEANSFLSRMKI
jgi:hypothetical protein